MRQNTWNGLMILALMLLPATVLAAAQLTIEVPYELYTTPKYGRAILSCTLADAKCGTLTSKRKTLKFKGNAPHKGVETLTFSGSGLDRVVDVKCEIKGFGDKVINAVSAMPNRTLQCAKWQQAITMTPASSSFLDPRAVNINQDHRGTDPRAVNINQDHRGTDPRAVNINQDHRGSDPRAVNINQDHRPTNPQPVRPVIQGQ